MQMEVGKCYLMDRATHPAPAEREHPSSEGMVLVTV